MFYDLTFTFYFYFAFISLFSVDSIGYGKIRWSGLSDVPISPLNLSALNAMPNNKNDFIRDRDKCKRSLEESRPELPGLNMYRLQEILD